MIDCKEISISTEPETKRARAQPGRRLVFVCCPLLMTRSRCVCPGRRQFSVSTVQLLCLFICILLWARNLWYRLSSRWFFCFNLIFCKEIRAKSCALASESAQSGPGACLSAPSPGSPSPELSKSSCLNTHNTGTDVWIRNNEDYEEKSVKLECSAIILLWYTLLWWSFVFCSAAKTQTPPPPPVFSRLINIYYKYCLLFMFSYP